MVSPASAVLGAQPGGGVGAPSVVSLGRSWIFQTLTGQFDPGFGAFKLNNGTQSSATALYISDLADSGVDLGSSLDQLEVDDRIYMQDRVDKTKFHLFAVTGAPIDNTTWHEIPIVSVDAGADLEDTDLCTLGFHLGAADAPEMYTTVVATAAELRAALAADLGDTFIRPGTYAIDVDGLVLNTTPRRFVGAAESEVIITLTATAPNKLDFSAGLTDLAGVEWANVTLRTIAAAVGPEILQGCFSVRNVSIDLNALGFVGFDTCRNMTNCTVDVAGATGATAFSLCTRLANCAVLNASTSAFVSCTDLTNCLVKAIAALEAVGDAAAFRVCERLSNCHADYTATTSSPSIHNGFRLCLRLSSCDFEGPTAAAIASLNGYAGCEDVSSSRALRGETGFGTCQRLVGCLADDCSSHAFDGASHLAGCRAINAGASGFFTCFQVTGCESFSAGTSAFINCEQVSGCQATTSTSHGFNGCNNLSACVAESNGGSGYDFCHRISACKSNGNTGDGYVGCKYVSSSISTGDANQFSDSDTEGIDLYTNNFQHIISPAALTADVNNFAGIQHASIARMSADALGPWDVNGIAPGGGSHVSRYLRIINVGADAFLLANQNVGSLAANRIITGTGADITVAPDGVVDLWYDTAAAGGGKWRVMQA